jgi:hypothetical protein
VPVSERIPVHVTELSTSETLAAPTSAAPGSTITLTANINSPSGVPTGQIVFLDGNTSPGTTLLDGTGVATLRINALAAGTHTLTASYPARLRESPSTLPTPTSPSVQLPLAPRLSPASPRNSC